jgi:hypothetical protein
MKKIAFLLLTISFFAVYNLQAQKQFAGDIRFQTKLVGTDDPNLLSSVEEVTIDISILGNKSKAVIKYGDMAAMTNIWDGDKEAGSFVVEITGMGKYYKKVSAEEWKEKLKFSEFSYKYEDEYKVICDYKCQKVVVTTTNLEDDSTTESIMYVTKEIGGSKINGDTPGLEGFPLLQMTPLTQYCEGCYSALEAIKITPKKIKDIDFLLPDDARNIDENPELKEMLKGMMGED